MPLWAKKLPGELQGDQAVALKLVFYPEAVVDFGPSDNQGKWVRPEYATQALYRWRKCKEEKIHRREQLESEPLREAESRVLDFGLITYANIMKCSLCLVLRGKKSTSILAVDKKTTVLKTGSAPIKQY